MQAHENTNTGKRFLISIGVTFAILIAEVIGGFWTGSLALLSDAAHAFMDVFALALSYLALSIAIQEGVGGAGKAFRIKPICLYLILPRFGIWIGAEAHSKRPHSGSRHAKNERGKQ